MKKNIIIAVMAAMVIALSASLYVQSNRTKTYKTYVGKLIRVMDADGTLDKYDGGDTICYVIDNSIMEDR